MKLRKDRQGETKKTVQGLTLRIARYVNSKRVLVEIVETGEAKWMRYTAFRKGQFTPNLFDYPVRPECTFSQAKKLTIGLGILLLGAIAAVICAII